MNPAAIALASYQLAVATCDPRAYEAAAHALAAVVRAGGAVSAGCAPRPTSATGPRLIVNNDIARVA